MLFAQYLPQPCQRLQHVTCENTCLWKLTIIHPVLRALFSARVPNVAVSGGCRVRFKFGRMYFIFAVFLKIFSGRVESRLVTNAQSSDTSCSCSSGVSPSWWRCRFPGCIVEAWSGSLDKAFSIDEASVKEAEVAYFLSLCLQC